MKYQTGMNEGRTPPEERGFGYYIKRAASTAALLAALAAPSGCYRDTGELIKDYTASEHVVAVMPEIQGDPKSMSQKKITARDVLWRTVTPLMILEKIGENGSE